MIPPDTSMPAYDPPLSAWPGIFTLAVGLILFIYLIVRIVRDYRRAQQNAALMTGSSDSHESSNELVL